MNDLLQRLKELSRDQFELFVHQYLCHRYPSIRIFKVNGSGGDQGIDSFSGELGTGPAVWQAKHFINGIGRAQKSNIIESLKNALSARALRRWTLCIPVDFSTEQHDWFQQAVVTEYKDKVTIDLIQGSHLADEVSRNSELRSTFFGRTVIDTAVTAQAALTNTQSASIEDIFNTANTFRDLLADRYRAIDSRFIPEVTLGKDLHLNPPPQGVVLSKITNNSRIDFRVRDQQDYNLNPLMARFSINHELSQKFEEALDRGIPFTLPADSVLNFNATSPLLAELENLPQGPAISVTPNIPMPLANISVPLKLVAGENDEEVLPYFNLKLSRCGRKEMELRSEQIRPVAFSIQYVREGPDQAFVNKNANIHLNLLGSNIRDASSVLRFMAAADKYDQFKVILLQDRSGVPAIVSGLRGKVNQAQESTSIIHRAAIVSQYFNVPMYVPAQLADSDLEALDVLHHIATKDVFALYTWQGSLVKDERQADTLGHFISEKSDLIVGQPSRTFSLMGTTIESGQTSLEMKQCSIASPDKFWRNYRMASDGEGVPVKFRVHGPCQFIDAAFTDLRSEPGSGRLAARL